MNKCIADSSKKKTTSLRGRHDRGNLLNWRDCHTAFAMTVSWGVFELNLTYFNTIEK